MPTKEEETMSETIDKNDLADAVDELKREHPSLPQRLGQYRDKRTAYEAKRMSHRYVPPVT